MSALEIIIVVFFILLVLVALFLIWKRPTLKSVFGGGRRHVRYGGVDEYDDDGYDDEYGDDYVSDLYTHHMLGTEDDAYDGAYEGGAHMFKLSVREPWFDQMLKGKLTVVARLQKGAFAKDAKRPLKEGAVITVARSRPEGDKTEHPGLRRYKTTVEKLKEYDSFAALLKGEGISNVFPGLKADAATAEFEKFYSAEDQKEHKVLAIVLRRPDNIA